MTTVFRVAGFLKAKGMTQLELSTRSGLAHRTVTRVIRNETAQVALETLDRIAAVLKVQPGDLVGREKVEKAKTSKKAKTAKKAKAKKGKRR